MPYQVDDALLHAMSGTELSRVRTELRLLPEPNNQRLLMSRGADIVMQSSAQGQYSPEAGSFFPIVSAGDNFADSLHCSCRR